MILDVAVIESVNDFLHSDRAEDFYVWQSEKSNDFINEPERAARCHDAAGYGCDGSYTWEVLEDFLEFGRMLLSDAWKAVDDRMCELDLCDNATLDTIRDFSACEAAFEADVRSSEEWHIKNGSYEQQGS